MGEGGEREEEAAVVPLLTSMEQIQSVLSVAGAAGHGTMILFKKEVCRKCAALSPKFERLPRTYADRKTVWVMVNADKLNKAERAEWNLKSVPNIHYLGCSGKLLEQYEALGTVAEAIKDICAIEEKLGEVVEPGVKAMSLEDLGFKVPEAPPRKSTTGRTGKIIGAETRAGAYNPN